jgi:glucose 1-dehydrogenase
MKMQDFTGKRVLVTGASSGIGRAIAVAFAGAGASVMVNHFADPAGAAETVAACHAGTPGGRVEIIEADVGEAASAAELVGQCRDRLGGLDVMISNAAIKREGDPVAYGREDFDRVIAVNLRGPFLLAQAAIRQFRAQGKPGVIINIASVHDAMVLVSDIGYAMSKAGVAMMTKTLAAAVGPEGIRVHAVSPGAIDTPMNPHFRERPESMAEFAAQVPLRRVGEPKDIANVVLFLASDAASYMTGQSVYVDGGLLL